MKKLFVLVVVILGSSLLVYSQRGRNPQPAPTPLGPGEIDTKRQFDINERSKALQMTERFPVATDANSTVFRKFIRPLYRDTKKSELELLAPDPEDTARYAGLAESDSGGLIRLLADEGCDANINVEVASEHCQKYKMPGAGSTYSFRVRDYRIRTLGDVLFTGQILQSIGVLVQGIFVELGDIPIDDVSEATAGVPFLLGIAAAEDQDAAGELNQRLVDGIDDGDFAYRNYALPAEGTTFALRSIAYRGTSPRTIRGMTYNELEFDDRKDMTVAFRVVRVEEGKSVTIAWKRLAEDKSPKLKNKD